MSLIEKDSNARFSKILIPGLNYSKITKVSTRTKGCKSTKFTTMIMSKFYDEVARVNIIANLFENIVSHHLSED